MRIVQTILSVIALALALFGTGQSAGIYHFSDAVMQLLLAGGGVLGVLGVSPIALPPFAGKLLSAISVLASAVITVHLTGKLAGPERLFTVVGSVGTFLGVERLFTVVGSVGTFLGVAGRSVLTAAPAPTPPAPPAE